MKTTYKGIEVEGTVKEIKELLRKSRHNKYKRRKNGVHSNNGRKMSNEHKQKLAKSLRRTWRKKLNGGKTNGK